MDQRAPAFIKTCIPSPANGASAKSVSLTAAQAASLSAALADDAKGAIYSGIVSLADALSGLQKGYFSWATVKLYYACFYFAKASISRSGHCVFYVGSSPYRVEAIAGGVPLAQSGNSHSVVRAVYKKENPGAAINSQPVGGQHAFDWLARRREDVNYRYRRFIDPGVPEWFSFIDTHGVRRMVNEYFSDPELYAFDEDHAVVALPILAMFEAKKSSAKFAGLGQNESDSVTLRGLFCDKSGPLPQFSFI